VVHLSAAARSRASPTADHYGLAGRAEATAYWQHAVLGPRLRECVELLLAVPGRSARDILDPMDQGAP
jgi:uncharacterized protein (DUF1810 family)